MKTLIEYAISCGKHFRNENAFPNEHHNGFELANELQNEFGFENRFKNEVKNENEQQKIVGNEDRNSLKKIRGNELQKPNKPIKSPKKTKLHPPIDTKFGKAYYNKSRNVYYVHNKNNPQYHKQLLHRLIYQDYHKITLLKTTHIHHIDRNPLNNNINNLQMLPASEHAKLHSMDRRVESLVKQSKTRNTSGYFRVCKLKDKRHQNNDMWRYLYREDNKQKAIVAKTIPELEQKVKAKKLPWKKL